MEEDKCCFTSHMSSHLKSESHFEIGQYASELDCLNHREKASVLVTKNNEYLHCFKIGD